MNVLSMKTHFTKFLLLFLVVFSLVLFIAPTESAFASAAQDEACRAIGGCAADSESKLNGIVKLIINIFSMVVGLIAVIMVIVAGMKYITSGGDSSKVASAKNALIYAIIGLVIVALAQVIVRFVLRASTKPTPPASTEGESSTEEEPSGTSVRRLPGGGAYRITA